jgi:hypothetical protein
METSSWLRALLPCVIHKCKLHARLVIQKVEKGESVQPQLIVHFQGRTPLDSVRTICMYCAILIQTASPTKKSSIMLSRNNGNILNFFFCYIREKKKKTRQTGLSPYKSHTPCIILQRLDKLKGRIGENH